MFERVNDRAGTDATLHSLRHTAAYRMAEDPSRPVLIVVGLVLAQDPPHRLTGQVMRYAAVLDGEWVALAGFGSAVLSCAARDRFVGWSRDQQYARLRHVINNQRLCVLPAGRRANLASAVLSRLLRRVGSDYLAVYGHRVLAVETFTDPARHTGACYQAANFRLLGDTLGFSRSAGSYHFHGNTKRVWWYPLHRDTQRILAAAFRRCLTCIRGGPM